MSTVICFEKLLVTVVAPMAAFRATQSQWAAHGGTDAEKEKLVSVVSQSRTTRCPVAALDKCSLTFTLSLFCVAAAAVFRAPPIGPVRSFYLLLPIFINIFSCVGLTAAISALLPSGQVDGLWWAESFD